MLTSNSFCNSIFNLAGIVLIHFFKYMYNFGIKHFDRRRETKIIQYIIKLIQFQDGQNQASLQGPQVQLMLWSPQLLWLHESSSYNPAYWISLDVP